MYFNQLNLRFLIRLSNVLIQYHQNGLELWAIQGVQASFFLLQRPKRSVIVVNTEHLAIIIEIYYNP